MRRVLSLAALCAGLLASACAFAGDATVKMEHQTFLPDKLNVAAGTKITWMNNDTIPHSVTANDGKFDSGAILPGKSFQWTATDAGTVDYHCIFHPSMTAAITVRAPKKGAH
jgi:plastocyanin